jgi:hypothetical protein
LTFQQGAIFGRRHRFSSWFLDIGRNDTGEEVSPSPHHSCGTYFLPTSDFSTTSINFPGRDSKLTICNSPCYATEDRCQQCDLYYVNSVISTTITITTTTTYYYYYYYNYYYYYYYYHYYYFYYYFYYYYYYYANIFG